MLVNNNIENRRRTLCGRVGVCIHNQLQKPWIDSTLCGMQDLIFPQLIIMLNKNYLTKIPNQNLLTMPKLGNFYMVAPRALMAHIQ